MSASPYKHSPCATCSRQSAWFLMMVSVYHVRKEAWPVEISAGVELMLTDGPPPSGIAAACLRLTLTAEHQSQITR